MKRYIAKSVVPEEVIDLSMVEEKEVENEKNINGYENEQNTLKHEEMKNKRGEQVVVELEPMVKMEVDKEPSLVSDVTVEKGKESTSRIGGISCSGA